MPIEIINFNKITHGLGKMSRDEARKDRWPLWPWSWGTNGQLKDRNNGEVRWKIQETPTSCFMETGQGADVNRNTVSYN